jgi:phospholipid-binding lipoprotein MlaA
VGLLSVVLLAGCATLPSGERDPRDRFERMNRSVYRFNDALDRGVAKPAARAYVKVTPQPIRTGIGNFFENLTYPTTMVNDLLQGKPRHFVRDTTRFVVNTTFGIGGLFDPATQMGLAANDEDLGQTLGRWGVGAGPYIVLPLLGPSTVRDVFGTVGDQFTDPTNYIKDDKVRYGLTALDLLDTRAGLLSADNIMQQSFDPYVFMRNAYLQRRQFQVSDGASAGDDVEFIEEE